MVIPKVRLNVEVFILFSNENTFVIRPIITCTIHKWAEIVEIQIVPSFTQKERNWKAFKKKKKP